MPERVYGTHRVGITVPDIEEGIRFFKAVFGAVEVYRTGPFGVDPFFRERRLAPPPAPDLGNRRHPPVP